MARQANSFIEPLFSSMDSLQQYRFIQELRQSRKTPKIASKKKSKAKRSKISKLQERVAQLSDEERARLLELLKES